MALFALAGMLMIVGIRLYSHKHLKKKKTFIFQEGGI